MKMAAMQYNFDKVIAYIFGMIGGIWAWLKLPDLLHIDWGFYSSKIMQLMWAGAIAFFSGIMGVLGKRCIDRIPKWFKVWKSTSKNKNLK